MWVGLSSAQCHLYSRSQTNGTLSLENSKSVAEADETWQNTSLFSKLLSRLHKQSKVIWPLLISTERECEILQGAAPHGRAADILSVNRIYHSHLVRDLSWHHQIAFERVLSVEPKSQDFPRFCQRSRDLFILSATPAMLASAPLTLTDGAGVLKTPWGESKCCSCSL